MERRTLFTPMGRGKMQPHDPLCTCFKCEPAYAPRAPTAAEIEAAALMQMTRLLIAQPGKRGRKSAEIRALLTYAPTPTTSPKNPEHLTVTNNEAPASLVEQTENLKEMATNQQQTAPQAPKTAPAETVQAGGKTAANKHGGRPARPRKVYANKTEKAKANLQYVLDRACNFIADGGSSYARRVKTAARNDVPIEVARKGLDAMQAALDDARAVLEQAYAAPTARSGPVKSRVTL